MKRLIIILLFFSFAQQTFEQILSFDQHLLKQRLESASNDTLRMLVLDSLALVFSEMNLDSSLFYAEKEIDLAQKFGYKLIEAYGLNNKGYALLNMGNYPAALKVFLAAVEIAGNEKSEKGLPPAKYRSVGGIDGTKTTPKQFRLQILGWLHFNLGLLYENAINPEKELFHYSQSLQLGEQTGNLNIIGITNMNLGRLYLSMNKLDSALAFEKRAYEISEQLGLLGYNGSVFLNIGRVYLARGEKEKAIDFFRQAIKVSTEQKYFRGVVAGNLLLSNIKVKEHNIDSGYYYARSALQTATQLGLPDLLLRSYTAMAELYKQMKNNDSIVKYQELIIGIKDSLFNAKQARQFQNIDFDEAQRQQELEAAKEEYIDRLQKYMLIAGLAVFLIVAIILWRNNINKQRAYHELKKQKEETDFQKSKVEKTLEELKMTQAQLIQSEKMASLGEMTAGIAHEIQNPLNFVNNFSDVNKELIEELKSEKSKVKSERDEELETQLLTDIEQNLEKINHHGKRADAIVKGMLQHSRASSGQKEPTDINALCDEYLRLAFHGLRAKEKNFNATTKTDFDNSIGNINVVPQDFGRVILNLINNAFYAVAEKKKQNENDYEPIVSVSTRKLNARPDDPVGRGKIEIGVKDNGNGIPQKILDKIFQPFFTTKPTGQGTGLGLSLSYDIIKSHGGELKVETKEGKGSEFIILLSST